MSTTPKRSFTFTARKVIAIVTSFLILSIAYGSFTAPAAAAQEITFVVNKANDDGSEGTLSWAAKQVSELSVDASTGGAVTIMFDEAITDFYVSDRIDFQNPGFDLKWDLSIVGNGSKKTTIHTASALVIDTGTVRNGTFRGLTFESPKSEDAGFGFARLSNRQDPRGKQLVDDVHAKNGLVAFAASDTARIVSSTFESVLIGLQSENALSEPARPSISIEHSTLLHSLIYIGGRKTIPMDVAISNSEISGKPTALAPLEEATITAMDKVNLSISETTFSNNDMEILDASSIASLKILNSNFRDSAFDGELVKASIAAATGPNTERLAITGNTFSGLTSGQSLIELNIEDSADAGANSSGLNISGNTFAKNVVDEGSLIELGGYLSSDIPLQMHFTENEVTENSIAAGTAKGLIDFAPEVDETSSVAFIVKNSQFLGNISADVPLLMMRPSLEDNEVQAVSLEVDGLTTLTKSDAGSSNDEASALRIQGAGQWSNVRVSNSTFNELKQGTRSLISIDQIGASDVTLDHVTAAGGPIYLSYFDEDGEAGHFVIRDSVLDAGQVEPLIIDDDPDTVPSVSASHTLTTLGSKYFASTVVSNNDLALSPLQDNGSNMKFAGSGNALWTMLPGQNSVVVNAASAAGSGATDQRGIPRSGSSSEAGAVERFDGTIAITAQSPITEGSQSTGLVTWTGFDGKNSLKNRADGPMDFEISTVDGTAKTSVDFVKLNEKVTLAGAGTHPFAIDTLARSGKQGDRILDVRAKGAGQTVSTGITIVDAINPTIDPTVDPTIDPTVDPTVKPTIDPTVKPTVKPTTKPLVKTGAQSAPVMALVVALIIGGVGLVALSKRKR